MVLEYLPLVPLVLEYAYVLEYHYGMENAFKNAVKKRSSICNIAIFNIAIWQYCPIPVDIIMYRLSQIDNSFLASYCNIAPPQNALCAGLSWGTHFVPGGLNEQNESTEPINRSPK